MNNQSQQRSLIAAFVLIILCGAGIAVFAQGGAALKTVGVGKPFGSRDPHSCGDLKGVAPTQAKALNSFLCHSEHVSGTHLTLIENASLQLGGGRAYNYKEDYNVPNIDVTVKVYPIRGSFKDYFCEPVSSILQNQGKNCLVSEHQHATGLCYKDSWGSWICAMGDSSAKSLDTQVAPPGGASANMAQTETGKNNPAPKSAPKDNPKMADKTPAEKTDDKQAETDLPKPDFTEMEKFVEIIKYEYGDNVIDHNLYIWVKPKTNSLPSFCMQFLDKDGMMVDAYDASCGTGIHMGYSPQAGQVTKFDVPMPYERNMPKVVSVRAFRIKQ